MTVSPSTKISRGLVATLAMAGVYYISGRLALLLAIPPGYATAVWPAAGFALAGVLLEGYRVWPGILAGSLFVNLWTSFDATTSATIAKSILLAASLGSGAALQAVIGAALIRRFVGYPSPLAQERQVLKFLLLGGPVSCLTNATLGVMTLWLAGIISNSDLLFSWWTWWVGDTIGALIFAPLSLIWLAEPRSAWLRRRAAITLPLGLTFGLAVTLFIYARDWEQNRFRLEFQRSTDTVTTELEKGFGGYIDVLHSIESFFASQSKVDRIGFRTFVARFFAHHPGIQALEWVARVSSDQRSAYEESVRREGFSNFQISEFDAQRKLIRALPRPDYLPVQFVEPAQGNQNVLGFDISSRTNRLEAMSQARDSGKPIATRRTRLVQETERQFGILIFVPVFKNELPHEDLEQRRQTLLGFAVGAFRLRDLVPAILQGKDTSGIEFQIFDLAAAGQDRLLYNGQPKTPIAAASSRDAFRRAALLEVAGRKWEIQFSPDAAYLMSHRSWEAWGVLAAGLLFTGLLGAVLLVGTGRTAAIEDLVAVRTEELEFANQELKRQAEERERAQETLRESEERFAKVFYASPIAISITSLEENRFVDANDTFLTQFGYRRDEIIGRGTSELDLWLSSEARDRFHKPLRDGRTLRNFETILRSRAGQIRQYLVSVETIDLHGKRCVVALLEDITERKRIEQELRQSEALYHSLVENLPLGVWRKDVSGRFTFGNRMCCELMGATPGELIGKTVRDFFPPEIAEKFSKDDQDVLRTGKSFEDIELFRRGTEEPRFAHVIKVPIRDAQGRIVGIQGIFSDVTERRRSEEALRQSEERFAKVFRASPIALSISTLGDGRFVVVNDAFLALFGFSREEVEGRSSLDIGVWSDAAARGRVVQTLRDGHSIRNREIKFLKKTGETIHGLFSAELIQIGGDPCIVAILLDITQRKRAEAALQESQALYHSLVEVLPLNVWRKDAQGRFTFANRHSCETVGVSSAEELIGKTVYDFFPRELAEKYTRDDQRVMELGQVVEDIEEVWTSSGEVLYVHVLKVPLRDSNGHIVGTQGIFSDVTASKRAEEALRVSEERFRQLSASSPMGVFQADEAGRFLYTNRRWHEITGLTLEESLGEGWIHAIHPEDRDAVVQRWRERVQQGDDFAREFRFLRPNGETRWVLARASAIRSKTGDVLGFVGADEDITERKQSEADLARARDAALESARLKAEFLANLSHEIRTPMNGVVGMVNLLLDTDLTRTQREYAETIETSADALLTIINDILDFSKIEAGKLNFETIDFDLRQTIEDAVDLLAEPARTKRIELASLVYGDVPTLVRGDPGRLRQVITNLLSNAVKFTQKGEVVLRATKESETQTDAHVKITVTDTGIGIASEAQKRLFQAFSQADGTTTRKFGGTGLGLAISRQLVERMGGEIGVESVPEKGSTFWFTACFEKQPEGTAPTVQVDLDLTGLRVLVVDDHPTNRQILREQLRQFRMHPDTAANANDALTLLRHAVSSEAPYRVALLDHCMPDLDGIGLAKLIKADSHFSDLRLIIMSSTGERPGPELLKEAQLAEFLSKPVKQSTLFECLTSVLSGATSEQAKEPERLTRSSPKHTQSAASHLKPRILLVEDNLINQKVTLNQLRKFGFTADIAVNGLMAVEAIEQAQYDIVMMDCQMPEMDGYEATRRIRASGAHQPHIIALTANAMQGDREKCLAAGMDDYLAKPLRGPELQAALARWRTKVEEPDSKLSASQTPAPGRPQGFGETRVEEDNTAIKPDNEESLPVDLDRLTEASDSNPKNAVELVNLYFTQAEKVLGELHNAIQTHSAADVRHLAHKLSGASLTCGMKSIGPALRKLEERAEEGDLSEAEILYRTARRELERLRTFVKHYLQIDPTN